MAGGDVENDRRGVPHERGVLREEQLHDVRQAGGPGEVADDVGQRHDRALGRVLRDGGLRDEREDARHARVCQLLPPRAGGALREHPPQLPHGRDGPGVGHAGCPDVRGPRQAAVADFGQQRTAGQRPRARRSARAGRLICTHLRVRRTPQRAQADRGKRAGRWPAAGAGTSVVGGAPGSAVSDGCGTSPS